MPLINYCDAGFKVQGSRFKAKGGKNEPDVGYWILGTGWRIRVV
jgi:hypothetical protein